MYENGQLNQVERFFANLTEKQIRRGVHRSTRELERGTLVLLRLRGASTAAERLRSWVAFSWRSEQFCNLNRQSRRKAIQNAHSRIFDSPFEPSHVRAVDSRVRSERLLRKALKNPYSAQIPGH
jgi:hypothetical protein